MDGVARRHHHARRGQGARYFAHDRLRRAQFLYFAYSKIVCRAQHGYGSWFKDLPAKQKSRQVGRRLFGLLAAILQIERDPPTASELSKLKYQK
jgi:hypothetical protein